MITLNRQAKQGALKEHTVSRETASGGLSGSGPTIVRIPRVDLAILAIVWVLGALYAWHYLDRGWVPHDEGTLAHSAERVLQGELPHRDYDEVYTGGLSYLNAGSFVIFGTSLLSIRLILFAIFLAWIPAVFYVARYYAPPLPAALFTLLAVAWSIPNYSAAIPSWYNLFLATFGLASILRFLETRSRHWLVLAGISGGLSILTKIVGLYFIAAGLLVLAYFEQTEHAAGKSSLNGNRRYSILLTITTFALIIMLLLVVNGRMELVRVFHFVLPGAAVALFLVWEEWRLPPALFRSRARSILSLVGPFLTGMALPIGLFLVPYLASSSFDSLVQGVFLSPTRRFEFATYPLPEFITNVVVLPIVLVIVLISRLPRSLRLVGLISIAGFMVLLLTRTWDRTIAGLVWASMRSLIPFVTLYALLLLFRAAWNEPVNRRAGVFASIAVLSLCSLIQHPFSSATYFLYVAPLLALSALAVTRLSTSLRIPFALLAIFYLTFAVQVIAPGRSRGRGDPHPRSELTQKLNLDRGGLRVSAEDKAEYEALIEFVQQKAHGQYILAGPDSPEVYFLAGLKNPTRLLFDFLGSPEDRSRRVARTLMERDISVVAINKRPDFSNPFPPTLERFLAQRYPHSQVIGRFEVRWIP
ncbi:MAG: ArnT family glycosyltransferase [Gammaproteobacteria bacterium]